jgi:hypothetical protein
MDHVVLAQPEIPTDGDCLKAAPPPTLRQSSPAKPPSPSGNKGQLFRIGRIDNGIGRCTPQLDLHHANGLP